MARTRSISRAGILQVVLFVSIVVVDGRGFFDDSAKEHQHDPFDGSAKEHHLSLQGIGFLRSCWVAGCGRLLGFFVSSCFSVIGVEFPFRVSAEESLWFSVGSPLVLVCTDLRARSDRAYF